MTETRDVLFELGTEELPPKSLLTLSRALQSQVEAGLTKLGLTFGEIHPYATPRRLALVIKGGRAYYPAEIHEALGIVPFVPAIKVRPAR